MNDRTRWEGARSRAANTLEEIGKQFSETRDGIIAAISDLVQNAEDEHEGLISLAVASLVELKAVESLPVIRRAYEIGKVDETVPGTWGTILEELGVEPDSNDLLIEESRRRFAERHARMFPRGLYGRQQAAAQRGQATSQWRFFR